MKYWHLTLIILIAISIPAIALTNNNIVTTSHDVILDSAGVRLTDIAVSTEAHLDSFIGDRQAMLRVMANEPKMGDDTLAIVLDFYGGDPAPVERDDFSTLVESHTYGTSSDANILLLDPDFGAIVLSVTDSLMEGYILVNTSDLSSAHVGSHDWYLPSLPWGSTPSILCTEPVRNGAGQVTAVLASIITGIELQQVVLSHEDLGTEGGIYIVGTDGRLITPSPAGGSPGDIAGSEGARKALDGQSGFHTTFKDDDVEVYEAYEALDTWNLAVVVEMDIETGEEGLNVIRMTAIASGVIVAGALVVLSVILSKSLVRDLGALVEWSRRIGKGDWDAPLDLGRTDEFQALQLAFLQMVRDMEKHQAQLRLAERRFSNLFANSLDPVYLARSDGRIVELNAAGVQVLGLPKEMDGTFGYSLEELFNDEKSRADFIGQLDRDGAVAGFEARLKLPSGREVFVLISATRRLDEQGRTLAYQGVMHNITDRKRFEVALIEAKNEAEFYCDIMSHDLNNAVQGLGGYLELCNLATDLEDVNKFLPYAHEQMSRASDLLRNVRRLSRLGAQDIELKKIDLRKLLKKSVMAIERAHPHESIEVKFDIPTDGPIMIFGESFIEDVFINLVDNAVKYDTHTTKLVDIEVKKSEHEDMAHWRVRIKDRGPGIMDRDKSSIFGRFERRALSEYGTGLGLSIVVKAVERSSGRAWVEDRIPGDHTQGAVFVVELLADIPDD